MTSAGGNATELLVRATTGDESAQRRLFELLYSDLHRVASQLRVGRQETMRPTALVHEAYLRLIDQQVHEKGRTYFLAAAATAMRRVVTEHARAQRRLKRGGRRQRVTLNESLHPQLNAEIDLVSLDDTLTKLASLGVRGKRQVQIIEQRFFAGLDWDTVASVLGISESQARKDWRAASAWLRGELGPNSAAGGPVGSG